MVVVGLCCCVKPFSNCGEWRLLLLAVPASHGSGFFCCGVQALSRLPDSSAAKESACSAGDPSSIPGLGRSAGEGTGYPLQDSWASVVAQMVKNPPTVRETWVWSLGWEDPLEEGMATHSSILAWRIPMDRGAWWASVHGIAKSWARLSN